MWQSPYCFIKSAALLQFLRHSKLASMHVAKGPFEVAEQDALAVSNDRSSCPRSWTCRYLHSSCSATLSSKHNACGPLTPFPEHAELSKCHQAETRVRISGVSARIEACTPTANSSWSCASRLEPAPARRHHHSRAHHAGAWPHLRQQRMSHIISQLPSLCESHTSLQAETIQSPTGMPHFKQGRLCTKIWAHACSQGPA